MRWLSFSIITLINTILTNNVCGKDGSPFVEMINGAHELRKLLELDLWEYNKIIQNKASVFNFLNQYLTHFKDKSLRQKEFAMRIISSLENTVKQGQLTTIPECSGQWRPVGNLCYFVGFEPVDFFSARLACQRMNGDLAVFSASSDISSFMTEFSRNYTLPAKEAIFVGATVSLKVSRWYSGEDLPLDSDMWGTSPPEGRKRVFCVGITSEGRLAATSCQAGRYVCEIPAFQRAELQTFPKMHSFVPPKL